MFIIQQLMFVAVALAWPYPQDPVPAEGAPAAPADGEKVDERFFLRPHHHHHHHRPYYGG